MTLLPVVRESRRTTRPIVRAAFPLTCELVTVLASIRSLVLVEPELLRENIDVVMRLERMQSCLMLQKTLPETSQPESMSM